MAGEGSPLRTLAGPGAAVLDVRRSKFLAYARPLPDDPDTLRRWLGEIRGRHPDAGHVVYGWRGTGEQRRGSDDGEPHGTGARPCQDALINADVRLAAVAVARIFGGTLLGAGNLGRAYGEAARVAISVAGVRSLVAHVELRVWARFTDLAAVERAIRAGASQEVRRSPDASGVECTLWVPQDRAEALRTGLQERTAGRIRVSLGQELRWLPGAQDPGGSSS